AVAVEHALLGERAVVAVAADVAAPSLFSAAIDLDLAARGGARGRAAAAFGPLPALALAGRHARLIGVVAVARQRVAPELLMRAQGGEAAVEAIGGSEMIVEVGHVGLQCSGEWSILMGAASPTGGTARIRTAMEGALPRRSPRRRRGMERGAQTRASADRPGE